VVRFALITAASNAPSVQVRGVAQDLSRNENDQRFIGGLC
jgi:hypothetical protein